MSVFSFGVLALSLLTVAARVAFLNSQRRPVRVRAKTPRR